MREAELVSLVESQVRRFVRREVDSAEIEAAKEISKPLLGKIAELGLFGLSIPEAYGGLDFDLGACASVVTSLARADRSLATTIGLHNGLGVRPLIEGGSESLRERYLPRIASGELIAAFAATEAGAGSDLTAVATTASIEGDEVVLRGEKHFVTNGGFAGVFTVLARTPGRGGARGQALVLVPRDLPGVEVGLEERKLGLKASSTVTVRFDGVRLPLDHILGSPGTGTDDAYSALEWGRTIMAAGCVGTALAALEPTLEHTRNRRQFGRALIRFPSVRAHLGAMLRESFAMQALVDATARASRRGAPLHHLSAVAKVVCSEGGFAICDRALQLHGGLGYLEDTGIARLLRDSRVTRIFEGANDVLLARLGTALYAAEPGTIDRRVHERSADIEVLDDAWEKASRALGRAVAEARDVYGLSGVRQQLMLTALARADLALVSASACLANVRTDPVCAGQAAEERIRDVGVWIERAGESVEQSALDAKLLEAWAEPDRPRPISWEEVHA